ncbi:MAG: AAA family ATPase [Prochloraceae cyanobacterium]|nr:AAA family ATPase [Prochloraceae cyanobacterium]
MLNLPNYQETNQIYVGTNTLVYRAIRTIDRQPAIVKILRNPHPNVNELVQFRNQYSIARLLEHPTIVQPLALENYGNGYALVMKDEGEIPLWDYWQKSPRSLSEFLAIATQLSEVLHYLIQKRIIHKDIKPSNILIHPETRLVKLIDFSISSLLPKEQQQLTNPNLLEGSLAYISPEQTGRMNRGIDYRTDFYCLGVTFFELLTGTLPFTSRDPMELVHCHIARSAEFPASIAQSAVPDVLRAIVLKLMEKNAEHRYQSALGLKHDLERCWQQLQAKGEINSFQLGERDLCDRFMIPEKLYGRETEVQTLLDAFWRVANGTTEIMLVAGFSGIGKTAVVNEVHKPIVRQRGYFIQGKFDQFNRNIPFSAFVQAFRDLMGQLLGESDAQLATWKTKILEALGENGQILIEVIPELERIIGKQPAVPEFSGSAAQNRFNLLFGKFVRIFTTKEHPLVIFLDDLQWVDSASLNLLKLLMDESAAGYLLMLGAYRDNEVFPAHPLMLTLKEIQKQGSKLNTLTLTPLGDIDITRLIADTLQCSVKVATPLSELVYQKTQGNPFFTTQFLQGLHEEKCIRFDAEVGYWLWNLPKVRQLALTEDVVEFMVGRLHKLPEETQKVLKLAACIGNRFDLETLAIVCEETQEEVARYLWQALPEGLVIPETETYKFFQGEPNKETETGSVSVSYRFLHDRVQQAAYFLIPESQKQSTHLKIGRLLLRNTPEAEQEEKIFDIVNQLNMAVELIPQLTDREELARLNLIAGRKAKVATAYGAAKTYLTVGIELLDIDCWQNQYDLTLSLYKLATEVAYLNGNFEQMEIWADVVLKQAETTLEKVKIYEIKITAYASQNRLQEGIEIGLQALKLLGTNFPERPKPSDLQRGLKEVMSTSTGKNPSAAIDLPEMTDPHKLATMSVLSSLFAPVYVSIPDLMPLLVLEKVKLSVQYGNSPWSAFAYGVYGVILCGTIGDIESGYQFGKLALSLLDKFNAQAIQARTLDMVEGFLLHWKDHARKVLDPLRWGYQCGVESGEFEWAGYTAFKICQYSLFTGKELTSLEREMKIWSQDLERLQQNMGVNLVEVTRQTALNLTGKSDNPSRLVGEAIDEERLLPIYLANNNGYGLHYLYLNKLILCYLFEEFDLALTHSDRAAEYLGTVTAALAVPVFHLYDSLTRLAIYPRVAKSEQDKILAKIAADREKMRIWARHAPMNHLHKFYLVEAEQNRVLGEKLEAIEMYDRAIAGAKENGYIQEEALANELVAKFYLAWGKEKVAAAYMQEAYYCYARWGAKAKVNQLEQKYPQLLTPILQQPQSSLNFSNPLTSPQHLGTVTTTSSVFDLACAIKASQALSGEIEINALLSKLMHVVIENAGADTVVLILNNSGTWEVVAQCDNSDCHIFTTSLDRIDTLPSTIINTVKRTQQPLLLNNVEQDKTFTGDPYLIQKQPKSLFCTSILNQGELLGILYLENNLTTEAFTSDHIQVLKLITTQAAISIKNARFYQTLEDKVAERTTQLAAANAEITQLNEKLKIENLRLGAELDIARQIQQMILPKPEELESVDGLDIAGFMEPADEIGGDYYDVLQMDGIITLGIGDVTGHGLESGLLMLMTQTAVRTLQEIREYDPVRFLDTLNRTIYRNVQRMNSDKNLTLAILNYSEGKVSISGQHEETLVVRAGGHIERIDTMDLGLPIGLDDDIADFIDRTVVELHPGDGVVLYTDGIPEAFDLEKKQYGMDRLCEVISQNWQFSAQEIKQAVIDDLREFIGKQKVFDDITLVILKQQ